MTGMSKQEMKHLVNRYIGVNREGYLGDFSYRTHENFYPEFCDLDLDPSAYDGSTRARFEAILESAAPASQAAIIRGILNKYPPTANHPLRTQEAQAALLKVAIRLESCGSVAGPPTAITSAIVEHAIADAEALIKTRGATSGVDRVHTMLHGYLCTVCEDGKIPYTKDATIGALFKAIREAHPAFISAGPRRKISPRSFGRSVRSWTS